ncbi:MAG: glycosyltransferase [Candidatus Heimdallarchaeota archaeon]|nr:MAG: glycosyltransferase [Candidatus Heimdallarchaeota archaeon]
MKWKKILWYVVAYSLFAFLTFYIIYSSIEIIQVYRTMLPSGSAIVGLILNFLILLLELFSAFFSVFIYYYIGSSSNYTLLKDENNKFLKSNSLPKVAVVFPLYREPFTVVSQTLEGAMNLDYPKEKLEIVVCDDSPPEHSSEIESFCKANSITFIRRKNRSGFKAGAINNALKQIKCDFLGILDADHIPTPNFIKTCLSGFIEDDIVLVQGKPMFVNQDDYLMRSSAFIQSQFYHIYQKSRGTRNGVIFAGTTGLLRVDLLKEFGGFLEDTLAEDTDTSFMLLSNGYKTRYLHEICSKGLVPWNPISMVNQVWRWTNGITSIFRKRFWKIVKGHNKTINKIDILSTVTTPIIGTVMIFIYILLFVMYMIKEFTGLAEFAFIRPDLGVFPLLLVAPILISLASLIMAFVTWRREEKEDKMIRLRGFFGMVWTITAFYLLMMTAQYFLVWAVISALLGVKKEFDRTIKVKTKTIGKMSQKVKYTLWSIGLLLIAGAFYFASYRTFIANDALFGWFIIAAVTATIPMIITIGHFSKLDFTKDKTAADVEREYGD